MYSTSSITNLRIILKTLSAIFIKMLISFPPESNFLGTVQKIVSVRKNLKFYKIDIRYYKEEEVICQE